jgi:HlyD family secretion protein
MNRRGRLRWAIVLAVLALLAAAVVILYLPRPLEVEVARVVSGPIDETVADQGTARVREAYVVAAPVAGRLDRIGLKVGDAVVADRTRVARIEPVRPGLLDARARAQAQAQVAAAAAAVTAAAAQQERLAVEQRRLETDLARTRTLADRGVAARQALDNAEAAARAARAAAQAAAAELSARRAELAAARAALTGPEAAGQGEVTVTSPASGYVTRVLQESERSVDLGTPLVEVSDKSGLEAAVEFLSQDAVRIREGMPAEIYDWGGPGTIPARVRRVEPQGFTKVSALGVEEQRVLVMLQFTGGAERWTQLGPGYRVWGRVILRHAPKAVKVPLGALVRADGGWAAFRLEGGRVRLTRIKVGAADDREAEVRKGLTPGDTVVVFPSDKVADGVAARPR